jgi:4-amino-4-deoxy-L-arabinose transferase-like glycosyltransferase
VGATIGVLVALRLIFWVGAFPNSDEAYYWLWGQHWAWSYFDHPPLQAWVQGITTAILGRSSFSLRLPNLLTTGVLVGLYGHLCRRIYGGRRGAWGLTVLLLFTSPLFFLYLAFAWHDHGLVLWSTLAGYSLARFLQGYPQRRPWGWLYAVGAGLGLAALSKYLAVILALALLVAIASHGPWRSLLWHPHLLGAAALGLAIASPILIWNAQHDWISFQFYLGRSVQADSGGIQWGGAIGFLLLTAVIFGPLHCWAATQMLRQGQGTGFAFTYRRVAIAVAAVSTGTLTLLSLKAPVLYYWNILAYPLLLPLMAGVFLGAPSGGRSGRYGGALRATQILGVTVAALLTLHHIALPLSALVDGGADNDSRMLFGWRAIAARVTAEAATLPADAMLLTTDYRSAAALAYQLNDPEVLAISGRRDQFDVWYDPAAMAGRDALLLGDDWHPICPSHLAMFAGAEMLDPIPVRRWGLVLKRYTLMRLRRFQPGPTHQDPFAPDYALAFTSDGERCQTSP